MDAGVCFSIVTVYVQLSNKLLKKKCSIHLFAKITLLLGNHRACVANLSLSLIHWAFGIVFSLVTFCCAEKTLRPRQLTEGMVRVHKDRDNMTAGGSHGAWSWGLTSRITDRKQKGWTGDDRKIWNLKVWPLLTYFLQEGHTS